MRQIRHLLVLLTLVLAGFSGALRASSHRATAVRGATPGDEQLAATIHAKLAKSKIGKDGFTFHVSHGVVTWEGATNVVQHKGAATRMARSAGAVQVVNNIQIGAAAREKAMRGLRRASVQTH